MAIVSSNNSAKAKPSATSAGASALSHAAGGAIQFEDEALVDRCRKGDMPAFGLLVAKYQDRLYNLLFRMLGNAADAEELAQETFLKALENIGQFQGASRFYTWLFRVAVNQAISHRRRGGRVKFQTLSAPEDGDGPGLGARLADSRDGSPAVLAMNAETRQAVLRALESLEEDYRVVVLLCDVEEMDYSQIAAVLDQPLGTIKSRLHRGRSMLRAKLANLIS
ncbi:MAG: sigma-70 family RNA polymerase sigma factor [Phycisphaerae bacterium]|nr:sigma-70 family RNA polymerase sigma factor [Phycisphaerae bacterium]